MMTPGFRKTIRLCRNFEQLRRTIGHQMLFGECWRAVHQSHQLDYSLSLVQITDGEICGCQ